MTRWLRVLTLAVVLIQTLNIGPQSSALGSDIGRAYVREDSSLIYIGNDYIEISFRKDNGGIWSLVHKESGIDLRREKASSWQLAWGIMMFTKANESMYTDSGRAAQFHHSVKSLSNGTELTLTWRAIRFKYGLDCPIEVSATVSVYDSSPFTTWKATVKNSGQMAVEYIDFPLIAGVQQLGKDANDDCLVVPDRKGRLFHAPSANLSNWRQCYPSCFLNMQFMAYYDASCGFYFATYDDQGNVKQFRWQKRTEDWISFSIWHYPDICFGEDYAMSYNVIVGVFKGDWFTAADIYKQWAHRQWWARDTIAEKRTPNWAKELTISSYFEAYSSRAPQNKKTLSQVVTLASNHRDYFNTPVLVDLAGWENKGAWSWGDYFPPYEGWTSFDRMTENIHNMGCRLMVHVGTLSVDTATDLWKSREPLSYAAKDRTGKPIQPHWDPYLDDALMCIGTTYWQSKLEEVTLELVKHNVDMINLDTLPPDPATYACYDSNHGHPVGTGLWYTASCLETVRRIVTKARKLNPNVTFTGEGICETYLPYLDVAKYWRDVYAEVEYKDKGLWSSEAEIIPLFNYVYHGYILCMDKYLLGFYTKTSEYGVLCISRMLVWGELPQINAQLDPRVRGAWADPTSFQVTLKAVEARESYAKDFLIYGQMLPTKVDRTPYVTLPYHPGQAHGSRWSFDFDMRTPVILHAAWKASDGSIGYLLVNICDKAVTCQLDTSRSTPIFGKESCVTYSVVDGEFENGSSHSAPPVNVTVSLGPHQVVLLVVADVNSPRGKATLQIDRAIKAVNAARHEGREVGIGEANRSLGYSRKAFLDGMYEASLRLASEAQNAAEHATKPGIQSGMNSIAIALIALAITSVVGALFVRKRRVEKAASQGKECARIRNES